MRANPGGEIAPGDVIGRTKLIERIWSTLRTQSLIMVAERRMGKSCVIKKMVAESPDDLLAICRDVEGIGTPIAFVERLYQDVDEYLGVTKRLSGKAAALFKQLSGAEIGGIIKFPESVAAHWKTLLERTFDDLEQHRSGLLVLFWDEFPLMLQNIVRNCGEGPAMELLDVLRSIRQTHTWTRMALTGSIGLHHVEAVLRKGGHANDATNDMRTMEIPPLAHDDAVELATELLNGEGLTCTDIASTTDTIASQVDCIAYYIHYVVASIKDRGDTADSELVRTIVADALTDPQDAWHLQHYQVRLQEYYGQDRLPVVLSILDEISIAQKPLPLPALESQLNSHEYPETCQTAQRIWSGDREELREVLLMLQRDHYLRQNSQGSYVFRFPMINRWWCINRSLI